MSNPASTSTSAYYTEVSSGYPIDVENHVESGPGATCCRALIINGSGSITVKRPDGRSQTLTVSDGEYPFQVIEITSATVTSIQILW